MILVLKFSFFFENSNLKNLYFSIDFAPKHVQDKVWSTLNLFLGHFKLFQAAFIKKKMIFCQNFSKKKSIFLTGIINPSLNYSFRSLFRAFLILQIIYWSISKWKCPFFFHETSMIFSEFSRPLFSQNLICSKLQHQIYWIYSFDITSWQFK